MKVHPLIAVSDIHLGEKVKVRLDDSLEALLAKLRWIAELSKELEATGVVCSGDLTDKWNEWTPSLKRRVCLSGLFHFEPRIDTVVGNHDVPGGNLDEIQWSGLGDLAGSTIGALNILPLDGVVEMGPFIVEGFHWGQKKTEELVRGEYTNNRIQQYPGKICVAVVHYSVGPVQTPHCMCYQDMVIPTHHVAHFGDIHDQFGPVKIKGNCTVFNPGALLRKSVIDAHKPPKVGLIWPDGTVELKEVPHTPGEKVFDLVKYATVKEQRALGLKVSIARIKAERRNLASPKERVKEVGKEAEFSEESIGCLLRKIKE